MDNEYWDSDDMAADSSEEQDIEFAIQQSLEEQYLPPEPPTDLPRRIFTAKEIAEGERRRDRELYGPPTPPRRLRQISAMNSDTPIQQRVLAVLDMMMQYNGRTYEARMIVIRCLLNDPESILSAQVRRPDPLTREERLQMSQEMSSAKPSQKKPPRGD